MYSATTTFARLGCHDERLSSSWVSESCANDDAPNNLPKPALGTKFRFLTLQLALLNRIVASSIPRCLELLSNALSRNRRRRLHRLKHCR
jgi:hypothetical protein